MKTFSRLIINNWRQHLLVVFSIVTHSAYCRETNDQESLSFGQIRLGGISIDDTSNNTTTEALALGGKLGYQSPVYQGVNAGVTFYTSNPIGGYDDESFFLNSVDTKGYSLLGEAFIDASFGNTHLKLGRQTIDTPFADADDIGMLPNTFEALQLGNTDLKNTTFMMIHLHRWAGIDSETPEKFTRLNESQGINVFGIMYQAIDQWNFQGWHYQAQNTVDISYLEAHFIFSEALQLGTQYAKQQGKEFDGDVWGVSVDYSYENVTLGTAFNQVSNGKVSNGFGGGPFFTSSEDHTIAEVEDQQAMSVSLEYTGIHNLSLGAYYVDFEKTENELDLSIVYTLNTALTFDLVYSDMRADGRMIRAFLEYTF